MTREQVIDKVIAIATQEVGYLEKATNSNLYSKTGNAGSNNYTKYWAEIKPSYQGQPWCACFVTWCFVQAFGQAMAAALLKHYPYVYCPTMKDLFTLNANPQRGDIVIFKRGSTFTHTGLVTSVNGDYFTTIEGNTSGASGIIANGGGVCKKGYYNSNLPGTKFCTPNYDLVCVQDAHWGQVYLDTLKSRGIVTDVKFWSDLDAYTPVAQMLAMIDRVSGGFWSSEEDDASVHWVQPIIISLCGKGIITDKSQFLDNPDRFISRALLMALVNNALGGVLSTYKNRAVDHWGRNQLDSLCDRKVITTPEVWTDFEAAVPRADALALVCKAFNI